MSNAIKTQIARIQKSEDGKALAENFIYLSVLQVAGYLFPFITMPYLARVIGVEGFGKIAYAAAIMGWVQTIVDWGFNFTATRDVAKVREDRAEVSRIFSDVLWAKCILSLISFVVIIVVVLAIPSCRVDALLLLFTFFMIPGHILFPDWFFQAMEKMKYMTVLNVLSKFIFTIAVFLVIKKQSDYIYQPLLISLGYLVAGILALYYIISRWRITIRRPNAKRISQTIRKSTDVFINNLVHNLYYSFSIILVGNFGGTVSNGILDAGNKFIGIASQFLTIIARTFFPFLSRRLDKHALFVRINMLSAIFVAIALFFAAPFLIKVFFTHQFIDAVGVLRIMSFSIIFVTLFNCYGTNYMIIAGRARQLRNIAFLCSLFGFFLSFPLIYFYDYMGAAITILTTRILLGCVTFYYAKTK